MSFFGELKRRNVTRVAGVYVVVGWILVQVATALEESLSLPDWFDAAIVALLLIGLPIALIFAWAFELTPEGVVKTEAVPEGQSITTDTGRKLDYALSFGIIALVIVIIWQQATAPETIEVPVEAPAIQAAPATEDDGSRSDASVAVLPFADMSPEGDQEYFSDGLSEEILNLLVRADAIDVVSRTSAFQFKNSSLGIPEIAAELNVRHIVEGSVRKSGNTVRVTAQLIDAVTDRHLWSDTYDRPLTVESLFEIQDDVANSIFEALSAELGLLDEVSLRAKRTTDDVDAYALFLRARILFQARQDLDVADAILSQAVSIDPEFSEAWEYRAGLQTLMSDYSYSDLPIMELHRRGLEYAERALALDPQSPTAIAAIANIQMDQMQNRLQMHDWTDIIAGLTKALEIDPRNPSALNWRGIAYSSVGHLDPAIADFRRCVDFEPFYEPCIENLHWNLAEMGYDDEPMQIFQNAMDAGVAKIQYAHIGLLARLGEESFFKAVTNHTNTLRGWRGHDDLYAAFRNLSADHTALAESLTEFFAANPGRDAYFIDGLMLPLRDDFVPANLLANWGQSADKFRQTQAFKDVIREQGVLKYWRENGFPLSCRPVGDDDFECD